MITLLGTLLSSVFSGGATGLLGILIQRFFDMKSKSQEIDVIRLNHQNAIDLKKIEVEQTQKEWDGRATVAQREAEGITAQAEAEERARTVEAEERSYAASLDADQARYLDFEAQKKSSWAIFFMGFVDFTRGMVRPLLTAYLVIVAHLMFNWAQDLAATRGAVLTAAELKDIIMLIISTLLYLATVAVVWWFGTRPPKKLSDR